MAARWTVRTGAKINGGLALVNGALYAASFDQSVYAIDAVSGRVAWSRKLDGIVMSTPIIANGIVVVGTGTSAALRDTPTSIVWGRPQGDAVYGLRVRDGSIVWRHRTLGEDMPSGVIAGGRVIYGNGDDAVHALDLRTGAERSKSFVRGVDAMSSAALAGDSAYLVFTTGVASGLQSQTVAVDVHTGRLRWRAPYGEADCSPAVANGVVYVEGHDNVGGDRLGASGRNDVTALDATTGRVRWRYTEARDGLFTAVGSDEAAIAPLVDGSVVFEAFPLTNRFLALDAATGRRQWSVSTKGPVKMSAVASGGRLYFGDTEGIFYVVDERSGHVLATSMFPQPFSTSPPLIFGGTLYVADGDHIEALPLAAITDGMRL